MEMKMQEVQEEKMPLEELKEKLSDLRKRIMTLEWDKSHNQLNSSMEAKYVQIKTDCEALQKKVDGIKAETNGQDATATATTATAVEQVKEEVKPSQNL
ncbi:hypothetical protein HYV83_01750 [Candidatus Woesearchaeota archaeon]|nr:hypothetical protein [Candidatus Woesearchaeota archaeon]